MAYDNELIITEQADADLRGIYEYITFELLSPENAARQLDRLEESIRYNMKQNSDKAYEKKYLMRLF